jgi:hypothetical protein
MTIEFEDFVPSIQKQGFFNRDFEPFRECLERANRWIEENGIDVMNAETVVLHNLWSPGEEGSEDPELSTSGDMFSQWHQCIRIWYRATGG